MVIQVRGGARIIRCVNGHANKKKILTHPLCHVTTEARVEQVGLLANFYPDLFM